MVSPTTSRQEVFRSDRSGPNASQVAGGLTVSSTKAKRTPTRLSLHPADEPSGDGAVALFYGWLAAQP
jgi:hypothetical protein